jgi:PAS domain S-box-containing protein
LLRNVAGLLGSMPGLTLFVVVALAISAPAVVAQETATQDSRVVRSVREIHLLPEERLKDRVAVDLECVVAYYAPDWPIAFLHDGTTGVYAGGPKDLNVKTGDRIRVRGVVGPHRYIIDYTVEPSDNKIQIPPSTPSSFRRLQDGHEDSQFVQISGQLVSVQMDTNHVVLEMNAVGGGRFRALIHQSLVTTSELKLLLGRQFQLEGIAGARFDSDGMYSGFQIWVANRSHMQTKEQEGTDERVGFTKIGELHENSLTYEGSGYFRVHAKAAYQISSNMILVYDETGTLFVELRESAHPENGTSLDIGGVLDAGVVPPILRLAEYSTDCAEVVANPAVLSKPLSELVNGEMSGNIVAISGEYVGSFSTSREHGFLLQSDKHLLPVFLDNGEMDEIVNGTRIEATGVWVQQKSLAGFSIGSNALYSRRDSISIGSQFPWRLVATLSFAGIIAVISVLWAVTLRQQVKLQTRRVLDAHSRQRQLEEHYADIFINAKVMVVTADAEGKIVAANPATLRITGRDESRLIGSDIRHLGGPQAVDSLSELFESSLNSTERSLTQVQVNSVSGDLVPLEVICWRSHDESGTTVHTIWHDISRRLQLEKDRRELEQEMVYAQKMESLGVLAGGIAHDFNNLLTVILGNVSLIQYSSETGNPDPQCLNHIEIAAMRAAELTQQMLAYAGRGTFQVCHLSLSNLANEMSSLLAASIPKTTHLVFDLAEDLPAIKADATQLRQVIMNLVLNGSESLNSQTGFVRISTSVVRLNAGDLCNCVVSFSEPDSAFVQLQVSDNGSGMDTATIEKMFDPFFSTKFSGRGLGLSTVLGIVRSHKGSIRVSACQGQGTRFDILLPISSQPEAAESDNNAPELIERGQGRVLVVDDELSVLNLMCQTLELAGLFTEGINDPAEALQILSDAPLSFDCVITDMTMPGISGDELARRIRNLYPDLPIILCSGFNFNPPDSGDALSAVTAFLKKPFSNGQLVNLALSTIYNSDSSGELTGWSSRVSL